MDPRALDSLLVLSDLHLSAVDESGAALFRHGAQLQEMLQAAARLGRGAGWDGSVLLVLAGDIFDFLSVPGYTGFDPARAPQHLATILAAPAVQAACRGLQEFLERHPVLILTGNHDPELALPSVQDLLVRHLGTTPQRLRFHPVEDRLECQVGATTVRVAHGNYRDRWNRIEPAMLQAAALGTAALELPPGSRLVLEAVRALRQKMPFVDFLKPEVAALLPILWYFDLRGGTRLAWRTILRSFQIKALKAADLAHEQITAILGARTGQRQYLAEGAPELRALRAWLLGVAGKVGDEPEWGASLQDELREYFLRGRTPAARLQSRKAAGHLEGSGALRTFLARLALGKMAERQPGFFDPAQPDELWDSVWSPEIRGRADVVICGHTHCAKHLYAPVGPRSPFHYLNTGTWTPLVRLPETRGAEEEVRCLDSLADIARSGTLRGTYAEVHPDAVLLRCWGEVVRHAPGSDPAHSLQCGVTADPLQ